MLYIDTKCVNDELVYGRNDLGFLRIFRTPFEIDHLALFQVVCKWRTIYLYVSLWLWPLGGRVHKISGGFRFHSLTYSHHNNFSVCQCHVPVWSPYPPNRKPAEKFIYMTLKNTFCIYKRLLLPSVKPSASWLSWRSDHQNVCRRFTVQDITTHSSPRLQLCSTHC